MAAKINWHRYGTTLRQCHSMYRPISSLLAVVILAKLSSCMKNNDKCSIAMVPAGFQPIKRDFSIHSDVVKILNEKSRQFINWPVDGVSKRVRDKAGCVTYR